MRPTNAALATLLIMASIPLMAQDPTQLDSLVDADSIGHQSVTARPTQQNGHYSISITNPSLFTLHSGVSVFNTFRGQAPSLAMGGGASAVDLSFRNGTTGLVIDGVPFGNLMAPYLNLNSSEFGQAMLQSSNNNIFSGSLALNGAVFLASRTGQGYLKPTVEFNSYTTLAWSDIQTGFSGTPHTTTKKWNINNGIAFMQDFGVIDTRISFNYRTNPSNEIGDIKSHTPSIRVNTGFDIHPKVNLRVVLDKTLSDGNATQTTSYDHEQNFDQATFNLNITPFDWLAINTQNSFTDISTHSRQRGPSDFRKRDDIQEQRFHRGMVTFQPFKGKQLDVAAYIGFQQQSLYLKRKEAMRSNAGNAISTQMQELNIGSTLIGTTISFRDFLFADVNLRRDNYSALPKDTNPRDVKTAGASFIFSKAFGLEGNALSMGQLRFSAGDADQSTSFNFPIAWNPEDQFLPRSGETQHEFGIDLSFLQDRITFSTSTFKREQEGLYMVANPPWLGSSVIVDLGALETSGWEVSAGFTSIKTKKTTLYSRLTWWTSDSELKSESNIGGDPLVVGDPNPEWTGSILNQLTWKRLFVNSIIDVRKGGDLIYTDPLGPTIRLQDGSTTKLREVSIGYKMRPGFMSVMGFKSVDFSIVGRNMITFYKNSDKDPDEFYGPQYLKSVSAGVRVIF